MKWIGANQFLTHNQIKKTQHSIYKHFHLRKATYIFPNNAYEIWDWINNKREIHVCSCSSLLLQHFYYQLRMIQFILKVTSFHLNYLVSIIILSQTLSGFVCLPVPCCPFTVTCTSVCSIKAFKNCPFLC